MPVMDSHERKIFMLANRCCEFCGEELKSYDFERKWAIINFRGIPRVICINCFRDLKQRARKEARRTSVPSRPAYRPPTRVVVQQQPRYYLDPQNAPDQCMGSGYRFAPNNDEWRPF